MPRLHRWETSGDRMFNYLGILAGLYLTMHPWVYLDSLVMSIFNLSMGYVCFAICIRSLSLDTQSRKETKHAFELHDRG